MQKWNLLLFLIMMVTINYATKELRAMEREIAINTELRKTLNKFLTNFSEVLLEPFERGKITEESLIRFGILHNEINNPQLFVNISDNKRKIAVKYVEASIKKYFGLSITKHRSIPGYPLEQGYYIVPSVKRTHIGISEIVKFVDIGDNYYIAYFNVYPAPLDAVKDIEGYLSKLNRDIIDVDIMKATVKKINENGISRYILIDYILLETVMY